MLAHTWDAFVIYVNCYSAVQETMDSYRRSFERPPEGLERFCRDANPFVWDGQSSFEEELFEGFSRAFADRFEEGSCSGEEGYAFCRDWLCGLEGETYGNHLVRALGETATERAFSNACIDVSRQVGQRAAHLERTPQDEPVPTEPLALTGPSEDDIEAVIALLAKGDAAFAESLRRRLAQEGQ